jgi:hypothetical protein
MPKPMRIHTRKKILASTALFSIITFGLIGSANAAVHTITTGEDARKWTVNSNSILEVTTTTATDELINGNGLDNPSLKVTIDGQPLNLGLDFFGDIPSTRITFSRWETDENGVSKSQEYEFYQNWLRISVASSVEVAIDIENDLGSDLNTVFTTIDGKVFSYEKNGENMGSGPIFQWVTDATLTNPIIDSVQISKTGRSLDLQLYVYAHDILNSGSVNRVDYLQQFALFAAQDINRTDTFIYVAPPPPPPVVVSLRNSANLMFNEAMYGSDTLSDPDGQLRKTLDSINAKYGYLLG